MAPHQFEQFVRDHQGALRAFLRRLTRDPALADDLAQDSFIKAHARMDGLQSAQAAKTWLFSIAYRCFLDSYKKTRRRSQLMQTGLPEERAEAGHGEGASPHVGLDISRAMATLSDECRACIMLSLAEGYSHGEVADITGLALGTVKSHIARGKTKLQISLSAYTVDKEVNHE